MNKYLCFDNLYVENKLEAIAGCYYPVESCAPYGEGFVVYDTVSSNRIWVLPDVFENHFVQF